MKLNESQRWNLTVVPILLCAPSIYSYSIIQGKFAGKDQRDVVREAIQWWDKYLNEIETEILANEQNPKEHSSYQQP